MSFVAPAQICSWHSMSALVARMRTRLSQAQPNARPKNHGSLLCPINHSATPQVIAGSRGRMATGNDVLVATCWLLRTLVLMNLSGTAHARRAEHLVSRATRRSPESRQSGFVRLAHKEESHRLRSPPPTKYQRQRIGGSSNDRRE